VLVVDDEAAVGRLAAEMLNGAGYCAEAVTAPQAALERLESGERFDLVFSDVLMPGGMGGLDLAREVGRRWPGLPVLLATGDPADAEHGGFPVLRKPYATPELTRAVAAMLRRRSGLEPDA
jgi:CheY-like chemotaxis protein